MISEQEIRDAAERYRQHIAGLNAMVHPRELPYTYVDETTGAGGMVQEAWDRDAHRLAKAYLAEHPDDDAELATYDWFKALPGAHDQIGDAFISCPNAIELWLDGNGEIQIHCMGDEVCIGEKTRGQVRWLLAILQNR